MIAFTRRQAVGGMAMLAATPAFAAPLEYVIQPQVVADGIWVVRGADQGIERANGGAIANIGIIATDAGTVLFDCGPSLRYGHALKAKAERLTGKPVVRVYLSHLHPDHLFAAGAFDPSILAATQGAIDALDQDKAGFSDGMYRLLGDWMRGTEVVRPGRIVSTDRESIGGRDFQLLALSGHSASDLALLDERTGTLLAGDLVFHDRAPSTPHADLKRWRGSLDQLKALGHARVVPGHGPVDPTPINAIAQTRDWIDWLPIMLSGAIGRGLDMAEAGALALPDRFASIAVARYEYQRSISHLWADLESRMFPRIGGAE